MILTETIFVVGKSVGVARHETNTGQITFSPEKPPSRLPPSDWQSIGQVKNAATAAYENTCKTSNPMETNT